MNYVAYAIQTVDGKYVEADTIPDLINENLDIEVRLIKEAIQDRMDPLIALILSEGDARRYVLDAVEELLYTNLDEPEDRLMKKVEYDNFTLFGIPEGPMPGETQLCLQCKWRGTDVCKMTPIIEIDEIRKLECRHFTPTEQTGFYLNYEDDDERVYLGIAPDIVAEGLELEHEDEAVEACKEWLDEYYSHEELLEMIAEGDTPTDPIKFMVERIYSDYNTNGFKYGSRYCINTEYGPLSFILLEDVTGVELTCPRNQIYYDYKKLCDAEGTEPMSYTDLIFLQNMWSNRDIINRAVEASGMYKEWLAVYNKLQPTVMNMTGQ